MLKKDSPTFIIFGAGGFPYKKTAASNKFYYMAKALSSECYDVILMNKSCTLDEAHNSRGSYDGIEYLFLDKRKRKSIISKAIGIIKANINLIYHLHILKSFKNNNYLMVSYCPIFSILFYRVLTKILGYKLVISVMEYHAVLAKNKLEALNAYLFWKFSFLFADAALPISNHLYNIIKSIDHTLPLHKIPALADFNNPNFLKNHEKEKYFLYCGNVGYFDVIQLVISSFLKTERTDIKLYLVISGKDERVQSLKREIQNYKNIKMFSKISNDRLYRMYSTSLGLLIPMRPCLQDETRFPQKVAEYLASGSPVITNSLGELKHYFENTNNVIFAEEYSDDAFKNAINYIVDNPEQSQKIGLNGREYGYKYFHYENIAKYFSDFLQKI